MRERSHRTLVDLMVSLSNHEVGNTARVIPRLLHHPSPTPGVTPAKAGGHPEMPPPPQGGVARHLRARDLVLRRAQDEVYERAVAPKLRRPHGEPVEPRGRSHRTWGPSAPTGPSLPRSRGRLGGGSSNKSYPRYPPLPPPRAYSRHLFRAGRPAATSGGRTAGQGKVALSLGSRVVRSGSARMAHVHPPVRNGVVAPRSKIPAPRGGDVSLFIHSRGGIASGPRSSPQPTVTPAGPLHVRNPPHVPRLRCRTDVDSMPHPWTASNLHVIPTT